MHQQERPGSLKDKFDKQLRDTSKEGLLNPAQRKKKILFWVIRTSIAAALYVIFWENEWVRWSLWIVAPLSVLSLLSILVWSYILERKIEKVKRNLEELEKRRGEV